MAMNIKVPATPISASTTTARGALLPAGSACRFVRVVNNSATSGVYVNAGDVTVTATNANIALAPFESRVFERDPVTDTHVAALLISGTAIISCSLVSGEG
jgi:hypothetical protein